MEIILSIITKYLITAMCLIYTFSSIPVLTAKSSEKRIRAVERQQFCMLAFHFAAFFILFIQTKNWKIVLFYIVQLLFFKTAIWVYEHLYPRCSLALMNHMFFLLTVGFVMLARLSFDKAVRQFVIVTASYVISLIVPFLMEKIRWFRRLPYLYGILGIAALSLVFVIGKAQFGSVNWIQIGSFTMQPSELVKILFVSLFTFKTINYKNSTILKKVFLFNFG